MITRVLRSGRPGVPLKLVLLAAGVAVFGLGCVPTMKARGPAEILTYRFTFTDVKGKPCTITQEDVVAKKDGKEIPADCDGNKKCGRASIPNGDSISFESIPAGKAFEIVFDPFVHGPAPVVPGNQRMTLRQDMEGVTGSKRYSFSVVAKDCNTLDPIIVVDH